MMKSNVPFFLFFLICISLTNCSSKMIFKVLEDKTTIEMKGVINSKSLEEFDELCMQNPNVNKINIVECEGSSDDVTNLKLSKRVYDKGLAIHIQDNGLVASGGTDFFLAGKKRSIGENVKIGVHSWASGILFFSLSRATDYPVGDKKHQPYIDYYQSIGFSQKEAEDFYYFTINAAPADSIHWMTESEIVKYKMLTD